MLSFVTAQEKGMEAFLSVSSASRYQPELRGYADSLVQQGYTKLDWCVVGLEVTAPAARAAMWAPPGETVPTDLVLIEIDWGGEALATGQELLAGMHALATQLGAESLSHSIDSPPTPPQYQEHDDARARLMAAAGYELLRDGLRWKRLKSSAAAEPPDRTLSFRSLPELGEEAFVEALAATYDGTRDAWINRTVGEHGLLGAARADFVEYQGLDHLPEWWELAYDQDGALAGIVMAARTPSVSVIGYVGVVPGQRGRGLAVQLVRRGTEQLVKGGADEIRGDCDRDNIAMARAFERAGYEQFARRRTYKRVL